MVTDNAKDMDAEGLEAYFAAARSRLPEPGPDFMARAVAAAEAEARGFSSVAPQGQARGRPFLSWLARWAAPGGGLVAASCLGLWLGFAGIGQIGATAGQVWGGGTDTTLDLMPGADLFAQADTGGSL